MELKKMRSKHKDWRAKKYLQWLYICRFSYLCITEVNADTVMSETKVVQLRRFGTELMPAHKLASLSLFKMVTLFGHPLSLHPIYKRPKGLFSVNVFYMNPSLCLCKPSYSSKQSPIEAELLNLWPDGFPTPRQSGELQFVLKVWA